MISTRVTDRSDPCVHGRGPILVLLVAILLSIGCSTPNRMTHLRDTVRIFNQQVRWGQWPGAATHVELEKRAEWLNARLAAAQNLKMSDVRLVRLSSDGPRATEATVIVTLSWYRVADMRVKQSHWLQTWAHTPHGWKLSKEERQVAAPIDPPKNVEKAHWP